LKAGTSSLALNSIDRTTPAACAATSTPCEASSVPMASICGVQVVGSIFAGGNRHARHLLVAK
jgi:hypothetical protein